MDKCRRIVASCECSKSNSEFREIQRDQRDGGGDYSYQEAPKNSQKECGRSATICAYRACVEQCWEEGWNGMPGYSIRLRTLLIDRESGKYAGENIGHARSGELQPLGPWGADGTNPVQCQGACEKACHKHCYVEPPSSETEMLLSERNHKDGVSTTPLIGRQDLAAKRLSGLFVEALAGLALMCGTGDHASPLSDWPIDYKAPFLRPAADTSDCEVGVAVLRCPDNAEDVQSLPSGPASCPTDERVASISDGFERVDTEIFAFSSPEQCKRVVFENPFLTPYDINTPMNDISRMGAYARVGGDSPRGAPRQLHMASVPLKRSAFRRRLGGYVDLLFEFNFDRLIMPVRAIMQLATDRNQQTVPDPISDSDVKRLFYQARLI